MIRSLINIAPMLRRHALKSGDDLNEILCQIGEAIVDEQSVIFVDEQTIFICTIEEDYCLIILGCGNWYDRIRPKAIEFAASHGVKKLRWATWRKGMERHAKMTSSRAKVIAYLFEEEI